MAGSMRRQRGITAWGVMFVVAIVVFVAIVGTKLAPHYFEYLTVKSVMEAVRKDPETISGGRIPVLKSIESRLYINEVDDVSAKEFTFKREDEGFLLGVEYEGTTWRFAPGAILHLRDGLDVEGHYEGVRQRDGVENDHDRWYLTTRYQLTPKVLLTAAYRRLEFDEDRWDDYIADLYSLSLTTRF